MTNSERIFERGLAIVGIDMLAEKNPYLCRFRGEEYRISGLLDSGKGPNRCIAFVSDPMLRYGYVAPVEQVRASARLSC